MSEAYAVKVEMLYGFKCLRPFGVISFDGKPDSIIPIPRPAVCNCAYCGRKRAPHDYSKCLSCGAPPR